MAIYSLVTIAEFRQEPYLNCYSIPQYNALECALHTQWLSVSFQVREHFLPPLLDAILGDYRRNVPQAREPEVLSTVTAIVEKMEVR